MQKFIEQIIKNLESNGFPAKRVSLPTERMYEIADEKGLSFNAVLDEMKKSHGITADIGPERTIFWQDRKMNHADMFAQAQEMMSKMGPEELKQMQDMVMNMSPEQKAELMKKAKDMGMM